MMFVLALTITLNIFNQAKNTADSVLFSTDRTNFYEHITPDENGVTRQVGVETIIPTLYRYFQDGYIVRILDKDGKQLQAFDQEAERYVNKYSKENNVNGHTELSDDEINKANYALEHYNNSALPAYMYGAPWETSSNSDKYLARINAYIYGKNIKIDGKTVDYSNNGLIKYKGEKFNESYIEYNTSGRYMSDGMGNWYTIVDGLQKVMITYQLVN